ncbi:uncharacterized protein LOC143543097 isoform X2 [Bidens hawaiensis]|uniref:uncharacterized protein LOC143543097 isoform X2 n=1 Tax=Bidens hawaiensis TaxID=980011 RepID=UPI00404940F4
MKYNRGSIVEVFCYKSWRCARIVSGRGHNYTVCFDVYPGFTDRDDVERVSVKSIRPCPPQLEKSEGWVPGDVAEVFHNLSWKMAVVLKDFGLDQFMVRLVGSSHEFEVIKSELRVRQSYQNGEWIVTGKVPSDHKDVNGFKTLKRASPCGYSQDETDKKRARKVSEKEDAVANMKKHKNRTSGSGYESSSGSCSVNSYKPYQSYEASDFVEEHESDAESVCQSGYHEGRQSQSGSASQSESQSQESEESAEAAADEIHRLELRAYRSTMAALHASGPLNWEKESMGQSTGLYTLLLHQ